jgi:antagonist of KipI
VRTIDTATRALLSPRKVLRVTRGPQYDWFDAGILTQGEFAVRPESNRTGLRLRAQAPILSSKAGQMTTEGVSLGAIQAPPDGEPIILFVDQQTTGGYPVIANVISADLPSVGQLRPGDSIRFQLVSMDEAREVYFAQEALLW